MAISREEFAKLKVGDSVRIARASPSLIARNGIVDRVSPTGVVKVIANTVSHSFLAADRERGSRWGDGFKIVTDDEFADVLERQRIQDLENRLNRALADVGNMRTRNTTGDKLLMALADVTAKAENYFSAIAK